MFALARRPLAPSLSKASKLLVYPRFFCVSLSRPDLAQKYAEKLQKRAHEEGVSVEDLKQKAKESQLRPRILPEALKLHEQREKKAKAGPSEINAKTTVRRDNSPVKPLAEIMDVHKILRKPHTAEQISTLWTVFHASRSGGTGRGYLSASIPLATYEALVGAGQKAPSFIVPLPRQSMPDEAPNAQTQPYEFFFLQWAFHPTPSIPKPSVLDDPLPDTSLPSSPRTPLATVLFTPLLEYKTRTTFATPHLVLTMYPDLSSSHGIVLLRGELTPSSAGEGKFLLSQQDAQLLALGMQRFYLASAEKDEGQKDRAELLRSFNEDPSKFRWEDLLRHANPTS